MPACQVSSLSTSSAQFLEAAAGACTVHCQLGWGFHPQVRTNPIDSLAVARGLGSAARDHSGGIRPSPIPGGGQRAGTPGVCRIFSPQPQKRSDPQWASWSFPLQTSKASHGSYPFSASQTLCWLGLRPPHSLRISQGLEFQHWIKRHWLCPMGSPGAEQPRLEHIRFLTKSHTTKSSCSPKEHLCLVLSAGDWQQASTTGLGLKTVGVNPAPRKEQGLVRSCLPPAPYLQTAQAQPGDSKPSFDPSSASFAACPGSLRPWLCCFQSMGVRTPSATQARSCPVCAEGEPARLLWAQRSKSVLSATLGDPDWKREGGQEREWTGGEDRP